VTAASPLVCLRDVYFAYPGDEARRARRFAVAGLHLTIEAGEIVSVIGPNSAGKTTLIRLLTRVLRPVSGEITLDGRSLATIAAPDLARHVAVVPQDLPSEFPFTVEQLVLMGRFPFGPHRYFESAEDIAVARDAMAATGVLPLADSALSTLSGGERQRAILARALAQRPRLLVLDEPTAHLDLRYQAECAALLARLNREQGMTVLLVSHDLNLAAQLSHRVALLVDGRVARAGTPGEVLEPEALEAAFGCRVIVDRGGDHGRPIVRMAWEDMERRDASRTT
jgi:iron complex transport system ATP-binding protein